MATNSELLSLVISQAGDSYVFGIEVRSSESDPQAFDCSELVEWACARLGVEPRMPDGSWYQARHCQMHQTIIDVDQAVNTSGALLFSFSSSPFEGGRPRRAHVAISQGNGKTFEARSTSYGVGAFSSLNRGWTHAGLIPGLEYEDFAFEEQPASNPDVYTITIALPKLSYKESSAGPHVRTVQGLLHARGYGKIVGDVDGNFGGKTDRAVREFQRRAIIEIDGVVGEKTWSRLISDDIVLSDLGLQPSTEK